MKVKQRYLSPQEAAEYLGVRDRWIRAEIKAGRLTAYKTKPGQQGHLRIRSEDLDTLMEARRVAA